MERRLAAIMAADLVAYSRLIREDEEGTIETLNRLREETIQPILHTHKGRLVKLMGDGMLVEFPSVVDAVNAGVETQRAMSAHNADTTKDKRFQFRIGINLGDVVIDGNDIQGDGVNLAARLENLASPGGICFSGSVHEQVRDRVSLNLENMGEQTVKNIDRPVQVWHWHPDMEAAKSSAPQEVSLTLPDKPSIAILPFDNMSGDPEQEYFADGITEDIITALSKFRWFFVIARNSTFVYKGQAVDVNQVGRDLGVRYVIEGSVRKSANRVRITAQLIEAGSGAHVWAERYDRSLDDIFELQDEITSTIAAAVEPELAASERDRAMRKPTDDLGAWDLFQRGVAQMYTQDRVCVISGRELVGQAIDIDPGFGQAYGQLAFGAFFLLIQEWAEDRDELLKQGIADAGKAVAIDARDYFAYHALGRLNTIAGNHPAAVRALETCININPNFALGYVGLGEAHVYAGDPNKAIEYLDTAMRLSPNDPMTWDMLHYKASAYVRLDDFQQAIINFEKACEQPTVQYVPAATLAALYVLEGREEEGMRSLAHSRRLEPSLSIAVMKKVYGVSEERPGTRSQRLLDALRQIGLEEG